ncbi:peptidase M56 family protein [Paenarthrobacter nicotinovorans]|uniref:peptidase M56 family protein n=1 Tax=Paenarthrobacter nicotinovorans TaxID=29320 RepID=UPI00119EEB3F|nr:peptidase M56 family protein [Paenarthrobacter nicotinovorans]
MSQLQPDELLSRALRSELVARVHKASPSRKRKHMRFWLGAGCVVGVGLLGGVGAAAAGYFVMPGSQQVTSLSAPVSGSYEGTATVDLGEPPAGTTGIQMELTCLSPGFLKIGDGGAGLGCTSEDLVRGPYTSRGISPLIPGRTTLTISTGSNTRWKITAKYVNQETTEWAVNDDGKTYGMENEKGAPDLIAVIATNETRGYVYRTDLEEADGTAAMKTFRSPADALAWQEARAGKSVAIPVYDVNGKKVVGEFVIGGGIAVEQLTVPVPSAGMQ